MAKVSSQEIPQGKKGITRRDFLKRLGGALGLGILNAPSLRIADTQLLVPENSEIIEEFNNFSRMEIFHFPNEFIRSVMRFVQQTPENRAKYSRLIQMFSESQGSGLEAEKNRKILAAFAQECGPQLERILQRIEDADRAYDVFWQLSPLRKLYSPLLNLQEMLAFDEDSEQHRDDVIDSVQDFLSWISPLAEQSTAEQRKEVFTARAQNREQSSGLWQRVSEEWERRRSDDAITFSEENEQRFREIFDRLRTYYPRFLAEVKNLTFTEETWYLESGRSFFRDQDDTIGFVPRFFLRGNEGDYGIEQDLRMIIHEISHAYDPNSVADSAWSWADPQEFLTYYEGYVDLLEGFREFVAGNPAKNLQPISAEGIEYFMMSRWQDGIRFGRDQLMLPEDWEDYKREMFELKNTLQILLDSPAGTSLLRSFGLEYFFTEKEAPLLFWQIRSLQHVPDNVYIHNPFYSEWVSRQLGTESKDMPEKSERLQDFPVLSQLSHINPQLIDALLAVGEQIFADPEMKWQYEFQEILGVLLDFKSLLTFVVSGLRYRLANYGGLSNTSEEEIRALYISRSTHSVLSHFFHMMTGPLTQYTRLGVNEISPRDEHDDIELATLRASRSMMDWIFSDQNAMLSHFQSPPDPSEKRRADAFSGFLSSQAHTVWQLREQLWGAEGQYIFPHAVKDISENMFPRAQSSIPETQGYWNDKGRG